MSAETKQSSDTRKVKALREALKQPVSDTRYFGTIKKKGDAVPDILDYLAHLKFDHSDKSLNGLLKEQYAIALHSRNPLASISSGCPRYQRGKKRVHMHFQLCVVGARIRGSDTEYRCTNCVYFDDKYSKKCRVQASGQVQNQADPQKELEKEPGKEKESEKVVSSATATASAATALKEPIREDGASNPTAEEPNRSISVGETQLGAPAGSLDSGDDDEESMPQLLSKLLKLRIEGEFEGLWYALKEISQLKEENEKFEAQKQMAVGAERARLDAIGQRELEHWRAKIIALEDKLKASEAKVETIELKRVKAAATSEEKEANLKKRISDLEKEQKGFKEQAEKMKEQEESAIRERKRLTREHDAECARLNGEISNLEQKNSKQIEDGKRTLEETRTEMQEKLDGQALASIQEIRDIREQNENQMKDAKAGFATALCDMQALLKKQVTDLQEKNEKQIEDAKAALEKFEAELRPLRADYESAKNENADLKAENKRRSDDAKAQKTVTEQAEAELQRLKTEIETHRQQHMEAINAAVAGKEAEMQRKLAEQIEQSGAKTAAVEAPFQKPEDAAVVLCDQGVQTEPDLPSISTAFEMKADVHRELKEQIPSSNKKIAASEEEDQRLQVDLQTAESVCQAKTEADLESESKISVAEAELQAEVLVLRGENKTLKGAMDEMDTELRWLRLQEKRRHDALEREQDDDGPDRKRLKTEAY